MIVKLRQEFKLELLLEIAQLPRATFYYPAKRMSKPDKYAHVKAEMEAIYCEHKGRYGYRRITGELRSRGFTLNYKTVRRLMNLLGLVCRLLFTDGKPSWLLNYNICLTFWGHFIWPMGVLVWEAFFAPAAIHRAFRR